MPGRLPQRNDPVKTCGVAGERSVGGDAPACGRDRQARSVQTADGCGLRHGVFDEGGVDRLLRLEDRVDAFSRDDLLALEFGDERRVLPIKDHYKNMQAAAVLPNRRRAVCSNANYTGIPRMTPELA
jgi:hypothetical protein